MDSFAQASHLGSGPSQLSRERKAELSLPQSWPTGRSLPASTTAPKSDNVLPRQLPVWQEREQQDSEDSLRQHTLRSPLNLQLVEKVNQDQPETMFMHYTISEDRCGDNETVRSQLLAALGARSSSGFVSKNIDEDKPNNVMSPGGNSDRAAPEPDKRALHIGGLDPRVTEDVLRQIFETTGPVSNVKIVPDKNYQSKGFKYAFVEFDDPGAAERAVMNRSIRVQSKVGSWP